MIQSMARTDGVAVETGSAVGVARRKGVRARKDAGARTVVDIGASLQNDTPSAASVKALSGNYPRNNTSLIYVQFT